MDDFFFDPELGDKWLVRYPGFSNMENSIGSEWVEVVVHDLAYFDFTWGFIMVKGTPEGVEEPGYYAIHNRSVNSGVAEVWLPLKL